MAEAVRESMPRRELTESTVAREIAKRLEQSGDFRLVFCRRRLTSKKFIDYWNSQYEGIPPPVQPDIDLLVIRGNFWIGIELKFIPAASGKFPTYLGLEQTLALLRFGFDRVCLWHCYSNQLNEEEVARRLRETENLIQKTKLPLSFAGLVARGTPPDLQLVEVQVADYPHLRTSDKLPDLRYVSVLNPFWPDKDYLRDKDVKVLREYIGHVLEIGTVT